MGTVGLFPLRVKLGRGVMLTTQERVGALSPLCPSASMAYRGSFTFTFKCGLEIRNFFVADFEEISETPEHKRRFRQIC
jgi:hypothetical protein